MKYNPDSPVLRICRRYNRVEGCRKVREWSKCNIYTSGFEVGSYTSKVI